MKNIACPISGDRISAVQPRIAAFIVMALLALSMVWDSLYILLFLVFDFSQRGFIGIRFSPIGRGARFIASKWFANAQLIDKAPKVFAARLGFLFASLILVVHFLGLSELVFVLSGVLIMFAGLECFFNLCLGCYVYAFVNLYVLKKV